MEALLARQAGRTTARRQLAAAHPRLEQVSPEVGALDEEALGGLLGDDPDAALAMLADMARATDASLRRRARAAARRLLIPPPRGGEARPGGAARLSGDSPAGADLDLDATVERIAALPPPAGPGSDLRWQSWTRPSSAYVLAVDASGSVAGPQLATAVVTAAAIASRLRPGDELAVVAFWSKAVVLRHVEATDEPGAVLDRLFDLRGGDTTDLAGGLRAALGQAGLARAGRREVIVLTDGMANAGGDPVEVAGAAPASGARIHVLSLSEDPDASAACRRLAGAGGGRAALLLSPSGAPGAVEEVLSG